MKICKGALLILLDQLWMAVCVFFVNAAIIFSTTPVVGVLLRRMTFMSGSSDVNANLCLFLRACYTYLPDESMRFDVKERLLGYRFLQVQYRIALWLIDHIGLRIMPPPLRPLFISYYGRAMEAAKFIRNTIVEKNVQQIVILGAGFDTTAYRTRDIRIVRDAPSDLESVSPSRYVHPDRRVNRYVKVMEVDLPNVQQKKLEIMRASMTAEEFDYYTEGVQYLACNFGVQSLTDVLLKNGFDPSEPSAFLWEGVTYYISMEAIRATLRQINELLTHRYESKTVDISPAAGANEEEFNSTVGESSVDGSVDSYMLIDYMDSTKTLSNNPTCWLWDLEQRLSTAIGTPFVTGIADIEKLLAEFGFTTESHVTRTDCENALRKLSPYTDVLFELNSTKNQNEPHLAVASAIFRHHDL